MTPMTTQIKVCGFLDPDNARMAVEMGADFLGLNFYARSPRYVGPGRAREIADAVRGRTTPVGGVGNPPAAGHAHGGRGARRRRAPVRGPTPLGGVFVNPSPDEVRDAVDRVGLDLVQLSGDEPSAPFAPFAGRTLKVFRSGG